MDTNHLIATIRFYLREVRRLQAGTLELPDDVEARIWARAEQAAERLARLAARQPVPVPVKRRPANPDDHAAA